MKDKKIADEADLNTKQNPKKEQAKGAEHEQKNEHENLKLELDKLKKELEKLNKLVDEKQAKIDELNKKSNQVLSTASYYKSESENIKKDFERYKERNKNIEQDAKQKASEGTIKKLLPILDNFESAISALSDPDIIKGFAMIYQSITAVIQELGAVRFGEVGEDMNPERHNCISAEPATDKKLDGKVAKIYQKGYMFEGTNTVIRPATVSVYKADL